MTAKFPQLTEQQRQRLGALFIERRVDLWPHGDPRVTPEWITENVERIMR